MAYEVEVTAVLLGCDVVDTTAYGEKWRRVAPGRKWVEFDGDVHVRFYDEGPWSIGDRVNVTIRRIGEA